MSSREVKVSVSLRGETHLVGTLWCHYRKGRESASFEYDRSWLTSAERFALEPALSLTEGAYHTLLNQNIFGAIGDSAPDRWGRVLMRRSISQRAKEKGEASRTLGEIDYLLGVNDEARQGALRFSEGESGPFLAQRSESTIPPLIELPKLLSASERFLDDDESAEDLKLLLAPGSSLGGARPKASVRDQNGRLSIAKFPRKDDEFNTVLWEAVALTLAQNAGLNTSVWRLETILGKPVLLVERFDREDMAASAHDSGVEQSRIPFLSAMSMLGASDGQQRSYLEIAEILMRYGASPEADMEELWRRIVFSILISNTDDHLRNHGFIYVGQPGWRLSPVYDVNPTAVETKARILSTTIDLDDGTASLDLALSVADDFRLTAERARRIIGEVAKSVSEWRSVADGFGLGKPEINRMKSAFEYSEMEKALLMLD